MLLLLRRSTAADRSESRAPQHVAPERSERELCLWIAGAQLFGTIMRQENSPAEDTREVLAAIQASLDAARCLRFAAGATQSERNRLTDRAADAVEAQECALWQWYVGRGFDTRQSLPAQDPAKAVDQARETEQECGYRFVPSARPAKAAANALSLDRSG